jgi:electron transport complex protein RnfG
MKKEQGSPILIFALAFTALISGVLLSVVYAYTLPIIRKNQAKAIKKAIFQVLPHTDSFNTYEIHDGKLVLFKSTDGSLPEGETVYQGFTSDGEPTGYAVPAKGPGFQDDINLIYGFLPEKKLIIGMVVLESKETPGLGDKINTNKPFLDSFLELEVEPEVVANKKGKRTKLNQVDTISGATISSVAVIKIINISIQSKASIIQEFAKTNVTPASSLPEDATEKTGGETP